MKQVTTLFLKLAIVFIGIVVLALCIFLVPKIGNFAGELYPAIAYMKSLVLIDIYVATIPFYFALYQVFKLLSYIDKNKAFSELSVKSLKNIKYCALTIGTIYLLGMPLYYLMAKKIDPPSFITIGLIIIFTSILVAIFAAVLQKLLQEAINIKSENDLTV
ncbi:MULTISPECIES: DUF2975 domain-containing protein [Bacillus]|uniref:DUF2975 domain-containing protein n=1 Tax=Bacillus wiedmannii TaxID=1890302 RepID=A0A2B5X875_9BACI|nr:MULTISPECIES: DUF2975 domain-containing protein [Bacillus]MBY7124348.1 DUF2975 domain-containing protein [Bacillus sp. 16GRE42]MCR6847026.1 DUF2975 domain-containing protein [Bacillus sp. IBL03825]PEM53913.1 hypothetical protein CN611_17710 [Bacillus wiedmannii]PGA92585.1 hypothetical protein COL92_29550 [Bacillus wiedmannii]